VADFARGTPVEAVRTRGQIEDELRRRGATAFGYNLDDATGEAVIAFTLQGLKVRMGLPLPAFDDDAFRYTPKGRYQRAPAEQAKAYDAEVRRRWRSLLLVLKAKLVAADDGITTLEREFLADTVLADGSVVFERVRPELERSRQAITGRSA
jgi:hypothetical protein